MRLELSYTAGVTVAQVPDLELAIVRLPWQRGKPWSVSFRHQRHAEDDFPRSHLEQCLETALDPLQATVALVTIEEALTAAESALETAPFSASQETCHALVSSFSRSLF